MQKRFFSNDNCYHVLNRSIAKFILFNNSDDYERFLLGLRVYRFSDFSTNLSHFITLSHTTQNAILDDTEKSSNTLVDIIAYCLMPTHIHLVLKQNVDHGISTYISKVLNSYTRFFNLTHNRKGPLWEGRFKDVLVESDEQLLHLTRYVHLNPTSAGLVESPMDWIFSSYKEYLQGSHSKELCQYKRLIDFEPEEYKKFVEDRIAYQKELSKIKKLTIDNYTG